MPATLYIEGVDSGTHDIYISGEPEGWVDAPGLGLSSELLTGRIGAVIARTFEVQPRRLVIPIRVNTATVAARKVSEAWLKAMFSRDVVVRIDDPDPEKQVRGRLEAISLRPYKYALSPVSAGSIAILCGDPLWQAITNTTTTFAAVEKAVDFGGSNAPISAWALTVTGTLTDVTVTVKDGNGATLATLAWTGSTGGDDLVIDASTGRVLLNGVSDFANYVGGFPVLDPYDETTFTLSAASGTPAGSLVFRARTW